MVSLYEAGLGDDKPDMEKSPLPANRILMRRDNVASTDTDMRGDVMSTHPNAISSSYIRVQAEPETPRGRGRET